MSDISTPYTPGPSAAQINAQQGQLYQNYSMLSSQQQWMPATVTMALAGSGMPIQNVINIANQMRGVYAQSNGGINSIFGDDVLVKQPSITTSIKDYINSVTGPPPIEGGHIQSLQSALQAKGFGKNLQQGPWDSGWYSAFQDYKQAFVNSQLAGAHKPASKTAGGFFHWLTDVLPKEAGDAVVGWAKSMPHELRQLGSDLAGGFAGAGKFLEEVGPSVATKGLSGFGSAEGMANTTAAQVGAVVMGQSTAQYIANYHPVSRVFDDVNTALLFTGLAGVGAKTAANVAGRLGENIAEEAAPRITTREAFRNGLRYIKDPTSLGIDTTGKSLAEVQAAVKAAAGEQGFQDAVRSGGVIARSMGRSADLVGNAMTNLPALERLGTWVAKLNDADGMYYRARTLAALPYVYKPIAVAGEATQKLGMLGAGLRLDAQTERTLGGNNTFSNDVQNTHVMDALDGVLKRNAHIKVFGVNIAPSIDDLGFVLHGGPNTSSIIASHLAGKINDAVDQALGKVGYYGRLERAYGTDVTSILKGAGALDPEGNPTDLEYWWKRFQVSKIEDQAINQLLPRFEQVIEDELTQSGKGVPNLRTPEYVSEVIHPALDRILENPDLIDQTRQSLLTDSSNRLTDIFSKEIGTQQDQAKMKQYLIASRHMPELEPYKNLLISKLADMERAAKAQFDQAQASGFVGPDEQYTSPFKNVGMGLATKDYVTSGDAQDAVKKFTARYQEYQNATDAATKQSLYSSLLHDVADFLQNTWDIDARKMPHFNEDPTSGEYLQQMIGLIDRYGKNQAGDVWAPSDLPKEVHDTMQKIAAQGYKVVVGHRLDWQTRKLPPIEDDIFKGAITSRRKLAEWLGVNNERIPSTSIGLARELGAKREMAKWAEQPGNFLPWGHTIDSVYAETMDKTLFRRTPNALMRAAGGLMKPNATTMERSRQLVDLRAGILNPVDRERLAQQIATEETAAMTGILGIKKSDFIRHWTQPEQTSTPALEKALREAEEVAPETPRMSEKQAESLYYAMMRGAAKGPQKYQTGLTHLEDVFRAGFGFAGSSLSTTKYGKPFNWVAEHAANLSTDMLRVRNELRFALNPELSLRKITKTSLNMWENDMVPHLRPAKYLQKTGRMQEAQELMNQVMPGHMTGLTQDLERALEENDIFHLYNHWDMMADGALQLKDAGLTNDKIRERLVRTFDYGPYFGGQEGRSAAERSMNFFFFPFSFDKKLYRNMSYYLLDHPGQTLLLNHALAAYDQFNKDHPNNPMSTTWLTNHMPLLQELQRVNAFAHGVSLGQFGGVNAPLLNLFLPQQWKISKDELGQHVNNLQQMIPVIKEVQNIMSESAAQGKIAAVGFGNWWDRNVAHKTPVNVLGLQFKNIEEVNTTKWAQLQQAYSIYDKINSEFGNLLKANAKLPKAKQWRLPQDPLFGKYAGEPFTDSTVRYIINARFPAFKPEAGAEYAAIDQAKLKEYEISVKGTPEGNLVGQILDAINTLHNGLAGNAKTVTFEGQKFTLDAATRLAVQNTVRGWGIALAEHDPKFKAIWDKYLTGAFGPLEKVQ